MPSKAKFNTKTKEAIYERDGKCCVICGANSKLQFHHVKFGLEANRTKTRNNAEEGVTICDVDHLKAHSCKSGEGVRQECILYLKRLYWKG